MKKLLLKVTIAILNALSSKVTVDFDGDDKNDIIEIVEKLKTKLEEMELNKLVEKELDDKE